jgi:Fur family transcriptional regulator, zinc uptake regulator
MDSTGALRAKSSLTEEALASALRRAAERAGRVGEKWTSTRSRVYELLLRAEGPIKAYSLISAFSADRETKPPTVYRALDFLEGLGLAHRIPSLSAYTACGDGLATHAVSFLICRSCGSAETISPKLVSLVQRASARQGFQASTATLEVRGVCRNCQK